MKIGFIGCGKMANVLIGSFITSGIVEPSQIIASDVNYNLLELAAKSYQIRTTTDNAEVFGYADIIFLATKPQVFIDAVSECVHMLRNEHLIVSIMAGVTITKIQSVLNAPIIRVMPNVACFVGQMAAGFTVGAGVSGQNADYVKKLLNCAGLAIEVDESELDAVTGLSGSGPAFVAYLIQNFIEAGIDEGLDSEAARSLAIQTFIGTATLLREQQLKPEKLIEMVSSPNGTTVAGRGVLENSDVAEVIHKTISVAAMRSRELSK